MQLNSDTAATIFIALLKEFSGCNVWTDWVCLAWCYQVWKISTW